MKYLGKGHVVFLTNRMIFFLIDKVSFNKYIAKNNLWIQVFSYHQNISEIR